MNKYYYQKRFWLLFISTFICYAPPCFSKNLSVDVTGSIITAFDDNITDISKGRMADFVTNLETGLVLLQQGKTHQLSLKGDLIEQIFAGHSNFDNFSEDLNLDYKQDLSKYDHMELTDVLSNADEPRTIEDAFGRSNGRYNILNNQTGLSFTHDFTEQISTEVHYDNSVTHYSQNNFQSSVMQQGGFKVNYAYDTANSYNVTYDYIRRFFEHGESARINSVTPGIQHYFTSQFYINLAAGADFINTFTDKNIIEPHFTAALTDQVDQNTNLSWTFTKADTTDGYTQDLFNSWRTAFNLSKQISQRLSASTSIFYGQGRYDHIGVSQDLTGVQLQGTYALNKKTKLGVGYSFTDALSNNSNNAYVKNYFFVSITVLF